MALAATCQNIMHKICWSGVPKVSSVPTGGVVGIKGWGVRWMSKYLSKAARKRIPMSAKWGNKDYYKGNRCRKFGKVNSKGRFIRDRSLDLHILVPDLTGFQLKPYVARTTPKATAS
mmetsp:Transcript_34031/g.44956  ORF Transcript_34031/g.44956 Transcript_34031/m.44956 type:complete len:117 (-) Transcript_34031:331-681(-)